MTRTTKTQVEESQGFGDPHPEEEEEAPDTPAKAETKFAEYVAPGTAAALPDEVAHLKTAKRTFRTAEQAKEFKGFQRVNVAEVDVSGTAGSDNSWEALRARGHTYADKAQERLGPVKGKDFRKQMTKAKRGTYMCGSIDTGAVNSIKFADDD